MEQKEKNTSEKYFKNVRIPFLTLCPFMATPVLRAATAELPMVYLLLSLLFSL